MIDFYYQLRQNMIETMQTSLKQIRQILGLGVQEFGDLIGLTRQTINNLETQKSKMNSIQYIAICAVIDKYVEDNPNLLPIISSILCSNENSPNIFKITENNTLLKKWFNCFPSETKISNTLFDNKFIITSEDFDNIAKNYRIFLDQSVLLKYEFFNAIQSLALSLKNNSNKFIIPLKVIETIQNQIINSNQSNRYLAQNAMNFLVMLQNENLLDIRGEKTDIDILSTFMSVFAKFKYTNRLAIITCNYNLAKQINLLNNDIIGGYNILILKYSDDKGIQKWPQEALSTKENNQTMLTHINDKDTLTIENNYSEKINGWERID
ncbi:hypothetical protein [Megamonas hypermegale]|uniref:hypothetical protein n=1 Tax=Megamonas hypermegale TaxID=158847 RepID=UPI0026EFAFA2|nr:hypothetical protein [Megamonas hypermegale]